MPDRVPDVAPNLSVVTEAMARVFVPIAYLVGVGLVSIAAVTGDVRLVPLAVSSLAVGVIGTLQRRSSRLHPLSMLVVGSISAAVSVPLLRLGEAIALFPGLMVLALIGAFSLTRKAALGFGIWCVVIAVWNAYWHMTDVTLREVVVGAVILVGSGLAGWRLLALAKEALTRQEDDYRLLFDSSPVATLEEDYTAVEEWLQDLRLQGVSDLRGFLDRNPDEVRHGISLIDIVHANPAAAELIEARSAGDLAESFPDRPRSDAELSSFVEQFVAIWEGRNQLALDLEGVTFQGRDLEAVLHWSVPVSRDRRDLTRVIVAISDITPRKAVEKRLARAVEVNQRLLAFEQALAACSRALLLGVGDDAIEVALETLREAIGADRAYLAVNVDDPELGPAFRVVNSASRPQYSLDDWVGMVVPWSKYPMAQEPLSRGEAFRHQAAERPEEGWTRSLLAVPVNQGSEWSATVGFVDIARRTVWSDEAVRMLKVAAPMLSTFWERETTRQRLEELVHSKDRFVATISHELRTPLSAVLGFAEELRANAASFEPHEATEILELIAEQSRDMADMVEDLLVAARADIGTISIHLSEVYLRAQAEAALVAIGSTGTTTVEVIGGPGRAWADPTRTRQIIRNLLTNAVRYGGGQVVIEATTDDGTTHLLVRDNGPGLPEAEWERIFEPYQRAHERPTQPASVGLGLTVSRQLARAMGGDLTYRADEEGSLCELILPADQREDEGGITKGRVETATVISG